MTQVPASMTNLFSQETARLRQQQEPSYQFPSVSYLLRKMVIMGNKMNFYLFSNSKRLFSIFPTDATTKYLVFVNIFKIF
jgi:DNA mismatch repair ATPase MutL